MPTSASAKPHLSWSAIAQRTWKKSNEDDILGRSAQLAYYFFLALFPMLIFLISTLGMLPGAAEHVKNGMFQFLSEVLPASASDLVQKTMMEITNASSIGKLSFGLIVSLWSASAGMLAIMDTLNEEHGVPEERSFFKQRAIAIGLTLGCATSLVAAAALILIGGNRTSFLLADGTFALAWKVVHWPAAFACVLLALALIYYFAPNLKKPEWHWITPGAVVGCGLWLIASIGLRVYLHFFDSYSATYGSLGAVIILLISFYLTGIAILMGDEVNVVIDEAVLQNRDSQHPEASIMGGSESAQKTRAQAAGG
jgi:membrane protein